MMSAVVTPTVVDGLCALCRSSDLRSRRGSDLRGCGGSLASTVAIAASMSCTAIAFAVMEVITGQRAAVHPAERMGQASAVAYRAGMCRAALGCAIVEMPACNGAALYRTNGIGDRRGNRSG